MGGGGSKISDLFFPDNPNRRARATQLKEDIDFFCNQYEEVKKKRDDHLTAIKPKLNALMQKYRYNTTDELDKAVQNVLKGKALEEYINVKKQIDDTDEAMTTLFQVTSIIGVVTGVFLGALVKLGVMSGRAALAAVVVIGVVLGAVALLAVLFAVFEGAKERENMKKAIKDLFPERLKTRAAYEAMNALANWLSSIKTWLDEPTIAKNEAKMKKKLGGDFAEDYKKSHRSAVVMYLKQYDKDRNAWTNEDPGWETGDEDVLGSSSANKSSEHHAEKSSGNVAKAVKLKSASSEIQIDEESEDETPTIKLDYKSPDGSGSLQLQFETSDKTSCTGQDSNNNSWIIRYESGEEADSKNPQISDYLFSLEDVASKKVYKSCQITFTSRPPA
ncbi:hypothetical protein AMATHDRAFT_69460 [Amanita thiersii Skay4041]|uniref:Uncharacterized protein n=1 Tax=Amanita thiersii Skay4041 TaxID=703135 RepID=A0A2A9NG40_9AGAR|nr:hypothetical protein AMATHDRAFT_69460 [Amanita thiersii Skay4041]